VNTNPVTVISIAVVVAACGAARAALDRKHAWRTAFEAMGKAEVAAVALLLGALMALGGTQIALRNAAHTGLLWANPLMRHIVLWLGCLGATIATARVRHINIDVFSRALPPKARGARDVVVHAATAVAAFVLGVAALRLVIDEKSFGDVAFMGLPTWTLETILPFAFFLISYRSVVNMLLRRHATPGGDGDSGEGGATEP